MGQDDRGVELEVVAAVITPSGGPAFLLVIHVMPTAIAEAAVTKKIRIHTTDGTLIDAVDAGSAHLTDAAEAHAEALAAELLEAAGRPLPKHVNASGRPALHGGKGRSPQVAFRLPAETRARAEALARSRGITVSQLAREALERALAS